MVNVTAIKVNFLKEIGELSPKRISVVSEVLSRAYPNITQLPIGTVFVNPEARKHVLLAPNQLVVGQDGTSIDPDFAAMQRDCLSLFDVLMLDQISKVLFDFVGLFPGKDENTLESSFVWLDQHRWKSTEQSAGLGGVGLRFFYDLGNLKGDFKVEPFLQDTTKYFMQLQVSSKEPLNNIEETFVLAENAFEDFTNRLGSFAEGLVNEI